MREKEVEREVKRDRVQTGVEMAGSDNLPPDILMGERDSEAGALLAMINPLFRKSMDSPVETRRGNWSPVELKHSLVEYFDYFAMTGLKPSISSIRLWLNVSKRQMSRWLNDPVTYPEMHDTIMMALDVIETQYINRGEQYPTMNKFLLETTHGHRTNHNVEVTAVNRIDVRDINSAIEKLQLDEDFAEIEDEPLDIDISG